jgi:hypothetical protein
MPPVRPRKTKSPKEKQVHQLVDNIDNVIVIPDNHVAPLSIDTNILAAVTVLADTINLMQSKMGDTL